MFKFVDAAGSYLIYDWADLYGLEIISIKAIDIFDRNEAAELLWKLKRSMEYIEV